jgi:hypothetical protein
MRAAGGAFEVIVMFTAMLMAVRMRMLMFVFVCVRHDAVTVLVGMAGLMFVSQMNIEFRAGDRAALLTRHVQVVAVQPELLQLVFQFVRIHSKIEHRADEHVAADAAEDVEVKRFHFRCSAASALIWLAA